MAAKQEHDGLAASRLLAFVACFEAVLCTFAEVALLNFWKS